MHEITTHLSTLLALLGYTPQSGWIEASRFSSVRAHRFALVQARDQMSVAGAFCWLKQEGSDAGEIAAPLVYVAWADDQEHAKRIHRLVWSQGLAPFLITLTPDEVYVCEGFRYQSESWHQVVAAFTATALDGTSVPNGLTHLTAHKLRASLFWREHALDVSGRVDLKLLDGLEALSSNLIAGTGVSKGLRYTAANGLIGKILYIQFLFDRGIIDQRWLDERGHEKIRSEGGASWTKTAFWKLVDDLDAIFNGSIFPISRSDRALIDESHIRLVKSVLKDGALALPGGAVQLSFLDIDLSVLRVETLAAVYEQFLKNVGTGERRRSGAYYTPPFLVDVVLDRIEETTPLKQGMKTLDPAAGSGVFLVGAYRRMLEHALAEGALDLPLVRKILVDNIFGVERNPDACHVAAFSLYLTMLDYTTPKELRLVAAGKDQRKLFPSLVGTNLLDRDFFSGKLNLPEMSCVVGNPPWQKLSELRAPAADKWRMRYRDDAPIGHDQAAELFVWKVLRQHLAKGGVMSMLIPAKSFVNPTAREFRNRLSREFCVLGTINFSHMRHRLFAGAKHACAALFVQNATPGREAWTWVYSPLLISQPVSTREDWPWTIIVDRSEIESIRQSKLRDEPRAWLETFMLRPVDRHIHRFVADQCAAGVVGRLGEVCDLAEAAIRRGGSSSESGVAAKYIDIPDDEGGGKGETASLFEELKKSHLNDHLPDAVLARAKPGYRERFSANFTLVPRNFSRIRFVNYPKAYSSTYLSIFLKRGGSDATPAECDFLKAIAKYLNSDAAMYFMATMGRRWLMDRRNVEPHDLSALPFPLYGPTDDNVKLVLSLDGEELDKFIFDSIGLPSHFRKAIEEFLNFRIEFKDGNVPERALSMPSKKDLATYSSTLRHQLNELVGHAGSFQTAHEELRNAGVGIFVTQYLDGSQSPDNIAEICRVACAEYERVGTNNFNDSLAVSMKSQSIVTIAKPLEYFRWTVESAYADSRKIIGAFLGASPQ